MNIINVVSYLNHIHVIHLSEQIFKVCGHRGSDKRGSTVIANTLATAMNIIKRVTIREA